MRGLNLLVDIWNMNLGTDDASGGAIITGTPIYTDVRARIVSRKPSQQALDQGLEIERLFDMIVNLQPISVNERDEVQIVWPKGNHFINDRFRIQGINYDSRMKHTEFTLSRIERTRGQQ